MNYRKLVSVFVQCAFFGFALAAWSRTIVPALADDGAALLAQAGVSGGLVVHLGCGDGQLTAQLRPGERYLVHGLDTSASHVENARSRLLAEGIYGPISVSLWDGKHLPYIDSVVNVLVAEQPEEASEQEMLRVLVPNGVLLSRRNGRWTRTVKPWPAGIDQWTHYLHGADGNAVAHDSVVGSPFHAQWVAGPKFAKSHSVVTVVNVMVSAKGRLFSIVDEGPTALPGFLPSQWTLVARDAFNGLVLWRRPLSSWQPYNTPQRRMVPADLHRRLVADDDRVCVYATLSLFGPVAALSAGTGETLQVYAGTEQTQEIICDSGVLYLVRGTTPPEKVDRRQLGDQVLAPEQKCVIAVRADTGEVLWTKQDEDTLGVLPLSLAARDGRVVFQNERVVLCLDALTGTQAWRTSRKSTALRPGWSGSTVVIQPDVVFVADRRPDAGSEAPQGEEGEIVALALDTGKILWKEKCAEGDASPTDVFAIDGRVWFGEQLRRKLPDYAHARNLLTGEVVQTQDLSSDWPMMHHHRCYRDKATSRYILAGRTGVELIDLESGRLLQHSWIRGNCKHGILPCNGLLYVPPDSCACYTESKLNGLWALAPERGANTDRSPTQLSRLEKGPAYGTTSSAASASSDSGGWPTFRHDVQRSGHASTRVSAKLKQRWQTPLAPGLTQPVIAGGRVYVASTETCALYALDGQSGKRLWCQPVDGRVDSPPTIAEGVVVFGSSSGFVYALRAADGALVWRYRAAPDDKRMIANDQLESVWPVHGSVLVESGIIYCTAGRSSYLDGGMHLIKLALHSGKNLLEKRYFSRNSETGETTPLYPPNTGTRLGADRELPGLLSDVLSADDQNVYLRHAVFTRDFAFKNEYATHLFSSVGFLDDTGWDRTYWLYGKHFLSSCFLWPYAGLLSPAGRMLVLDEHDVYGFREPQTHVKTRLTEVKPTMPMLFRVAREPATHDETEGPKRRKRDQTVKQAHLKERQYAYDWETESPIIVRAMVVTRSLLLTAGPERFDEKKLADYFLANATDQAELPDYVREALDCFAGRKGGRVVAIDKSNGKIVAELPLDAAPVFDGMAAAGGRLFVSTSNGSVVCLGGNG